MYILGMRDVHFFYKFSTLNVSHNKLRKAALTNHISMLQ